MLADKNGHTFVNRSSHVRLTARDLARGGKDCVTLTVIVKYLLQIQMNEVLNLELKFDF